MNRQGRGVGNVPVVFTSALGFRRPGSLDAVETDATGWDRLRTTLYHVSSTPQVWISPHISDEDGNLLCNLAVLLALFPAGMFHSLVSPSHPLLPVLLPPLLLF